MRDSNRHGKCNSNSIFFRYLTIFTALFACSFPLNHAAALEFQCQVPGDVRFLHVDIPGKERLCEVSVSYESSGDRKVMWHARSDTLFCSAKAYELRGKYETLWGYNCDTWPDRDGIDTLSRSQRAILDTLLKQAINQAADANPSYTVTSVKAVASTPLEGRPAKLAFQFFTTIGNRTQIVEDTGSSWSVATTIDELQNQIDADSEVDTALIHSIDDTGTLEIHTYQINESRQSCFGSQLMSVMEDDTLHSRNPHRYFCETLAGDW